MVTLVNEDFEDGTIGYTTSISEVSELPGSADYFGRIDYATINATTFINTPICKGTVFSV